MAEAIKTPESSGGSPERESSIDPLSIVGGLWNEVFIGFVPNLLREAEVLFGFSDSKS